MPPPLKPAESTGGRLVIVPPQTEDLLDRLSKSLLYESTGSPVDTVLEIVESHRKEGSDVEVHPSALVYADQDIAAGEKARICAWAMAEFRKRLPP